MSKDGKSEITFMRGARSFMQGRFETVAREVFDDGWTPEEKDERPLETQVTIERARTILSHNDSPDVGFSTSINPYRGCEHGCIYCVSGDTPVLMADGTTRTDFTQSQYTFTERHYSAEFSVGRKPWTVGRGAPPPTDSAIVDAWKNMVASSGSYDRTDSTYTTHPVVGKDPQANYAGRTLAYRIRGDSLFLTALGSTPSMGIRRIGLVRVE